MARVTHGEGLLAAPGELTSLGDTSIARRLETMIVSPSKLDPNVILSIVEGL